MFMNDYDIEVAQRRFLRASCPNRYGLALMVGHLAEWTDQHSDGWAYWAKPQRAAARAIALIESRTNAENDAQERTDITDAEMAVAVRPVKAFLTRQQVSPDWRECILRSTEPVKGA